MRTVIAYASRYGTSEKVARLLAARLPGEVTVVNVVEDGQINWNQVDHIIVGGSIRMGKVQAELTKWLKRNKSQLQARPLGLYLCAGTPFAAELKKELEEAYDVSLREHAYFVEVVGHGYDFERMGLFDRMVVRLLIKQKETVLDLDEDRLERLVNEARSFYGNEVSRMGSQQGKGTPPDGV